MSIYSILLYGGARVSFTLPQEILRNEKFRVKGTFESIEYLSKKNVYVPTSRKRKYDNWPFIGRPSRHGKKEKYTTEDRFNFLRGALDGSIDSLPDDLDAPFIRYIFESERERKNDSKKVLVKTLNNK